MKIPTITIATVLIMIDAALSGIVPVGVPDVNVRFAKKSRTEIRHVDRVNSGAVKNRQHPDQRITSR